MASSRQTRMAPATPENVAAAAACLRAGGLVAMPTETVYGLAADATSDAAVAALFEAKGRPAFNPLIAHVLGVAEAQELALFDQNAELLARDVLAGAANLGSAGRLEPRESPRARRPRHARGARARAPGRARADRGGGRAARRRPRPIARVGSARRRPIMCSPTSRAGSTGSLTAALRDSVSNRPSWHAWARPRCCALARSPGRRSRLCSGIGSTGRSRRARCRTPPGS